MSSFLKLLLNIEVFINNNSDPQSFTFALFTKKLHISICPFSLLIRSRLSALSTFSSTVNSFFLLSIRLSLMTTYSSPLRLFSLHKSVIFSRKKFSFSPLMPIKALYSSSDFHTGCILEFLSNNSLLNSSGNTFLAK